MLGDYMMDKLAADMEWKSWSGSDCPIHPEENIEIKLRSGELNRGRAKEFCWAHGIGPFGYEGDDDIISYRVVEAV